MVTGIVDHTRDDHGVVHARLLDLVPGRSGKAYADWLKDRGPGFTAGIKTAALDPFRGCANGEAITLDRSDIDWSESLLLIRESKFGKSRLVPLHSTAMQALSAYAQLRDELEPRPEEQSFFVSQTHRRLCCAVVCQTFRQLVDAAGVGHGAPSAPRLHDLRHTFAVRTLLSWYRTGEDVEAKLPWLSTYLGHREPASTYWYLSAAPELLALAAARQITRWTAVRS
ncbi:tyrosine-type recombinase/integrase [Pseudarthrobacter sp. YS3]|uniref:tyrosine-type recombinase/integrase n=1 Tax=Pseudarthrobacter sp. YS3 TaxID=3453718 RepID=UPI003EE8BEF3